MGPDCCVWCWQPAAGSSLKDVKAGNDFRGGQWIQLIISGLNSCSFQLRFLALQRCQQGAGGAPQGSRLILFLWCLRLAPRAVLVSPHSLRGPARAHSSSVWPTGPCFALVPVLPYFLLYPSLVWGFEFRWGVTKLSLPGAPFSLALLPGSLLCAGCHAGPGLCLQARWWLLFSPGWRVFFPFSLSFLNESASTKPSVSAAPCCLALASVVWCCGAPAVRPGSLLCPSHSSAEARC